MKSGRHNPSPIYPELARSFLRRPLGRCHCPRPAPRDPATCGSALHALLEWLPIKGIIGQKTGKAASPAEQLIEEFDRYLVEVCGMAQTTRRARGRTALELLAWRFGKGPLRLQQMGPGDLVRFVAFRARSLCPMSVRAYPIPSAVSCVFFISRAVAARVWILPCPPCMRGIAPSSQP